jgi:two-component system NtrC family sensor kinase
MADSITDAGPRIKTKHRRKDGSIFDVDITSSAAIFSGQKLIYCVCRDISEREKAQEALRISEEKYRTLIALSPDGIVSVTEQGIVTFASKQIYKIFGFPDEKEVIGQPVLNWIAVDDREKMASNIKKALLGEDVGIHEYHVIRKGGEQFWIEANSSIIKDTQGNPTGLLGIIRDITERKKMQDSMIMTDRLASIGELASGMAHELNNPLTAVIGFADIILEEDDINTIKEDIALLNHEAKRMAEVTKNMLTFARKHPAIKTQLNINDVVSKVMEIRAYEHRLNNVQVITNLTEDLPEVTGDYFQLQQVVLNIVINAEYFMKEAHNGGTLDIKTEKTENGIRLSITDNGPGIAKENLTRIFDPFFTTKPIGKGTGLGLSICFGIIQEHNGNIYTVSELGKGTTFIIELPVMN